MKETLFFLPHGLKGVAAESCGRSAALRLLLIVALLGAACVPRDVAPQAVLVDPARIAAEKTLAGEAAWPSSAWWTVYDDPQLVELVAQATAQSPTLRLAEARVRHAAAMAQSAGAGLYPQIGMDGHTLFTHFTRQALKPVEISGRAAWDASALGTAAFTLDLWGREKASYTAGLSDLAASAAQSREARLVLESGVVRSYITLSYQYGLLRVARKNLALRENVFTITRKLFQSGIGAELAVDQAAVRIPTARARIAEIEALIAVTKYQIAALAGQGPDAAEKIAAPRLLLMGLPGLPDPPSLPAHLPAELLGRRPDIVARRWRVEAAAQNIQVAKAAFYPSVNLLASFGYVSFGLEHFLTASAGNGAVGPALSLPLFQGGRLTGNLRAGTAAYDEAVEDYNQSVFDAFAAVAGCLRQARSLETQSKEAARALRLARKAYAAAETGYRSGLTDYLNVLSAQDALLGTEERAVAVAAQRLDAHARLMRELGGGYDDNSDDKGRKP